MNEKTAKNLRRIARYKNASKTPSPIKFPGVSKMVSFPAVRKRTATRTSYVFKQGAWVKESREVEAVVRTNRMVKMACPVIPGGMVWVHDIELDYEQDKDGNQVMRTEAIAFSKPARLVDEEKLAKSLNRAVETLGEEDSRSDDNPADRDLNILIMALFSPDSETSQTNRANYKLLKRAASKGVF